MWIATGIALFCGIIGAFIFGLSIGRWKEQESQKKISMSQSRENQKLK